MSIVDVQELICPCRHIVVGLAFGSSLIYEPVNWII